MRPRLCSVLLDRSIRQRTSTSACAAQLTFARALYRRPPHLRMPPSPLPPPPPHSPPPAPPSPPRTHQPPPSPPQATAPPDDQTMSPAFVSSFPAPLSRPRPRSAARASLSPGGSGANAAPTPPADGAPAPAPSLASKRLQNRASAPPAAQPGSTAPPAVLSEFVLSPPKPGIDFHGIPNPPPGSPLLLSDLRERLIRQEETIIFSIIERAQFRANEVIYVPNAFDLPAYPHLSFSQYMLYELEKVSASVGRYSSPDEHPFSRRDSLPPSVLPALEFPTTLVRNAVNVNPTIERVYRDSILPVICEPGDDQNYGSAATCDASVLQALSKRIHYGKFIAESKCQGDERAYARLAAARDRAAIWELLSNRAVERNLLKRIENKARNYGSDITDEGAREVYKVEPALIADLYRDFIIPLTKEVEVDYIIERYERKDR